MPRTAIRALPLALVMALAVITPAAAARQASFAFTACATAGGGVQTSMTWSGFKVDGYSFGYGQYNGQGLGVFQPMKASSTGSVSYTWAALSNTVEQVAGDLYF